MISSECRVAIVGAGPQGLTAAAHLVAAGVDPGDIVVIDPLGSWLSAWRRRFARLGIDHLRSPAVHHPHPDPYALARYACDCDRQDELLLRYGLPTTSLFSDFCDHVIAEHGLGAAVVAASVEDLDGDGLLSIDSGVTVRARHVVWATDPAVSPPTGVDPRVREWDSDEGAAGPWASSRVVVLGGGLSAAHLVERAIAADCSVDWVTRAPLRIREFDTDPGWLGPKEMLRFLAEPDPEARLAMVVSARGGGTVPSWMMERLRPALARRQVRCRVAGFGFDPAGELLIDGRSVAADEIWPALGSSPSISASRALDRLGRRVAVPRCGERPVLDRWLRLGATNVHVMGRLAQLQLGPTAGNLAGARHGAVCVVAGVLGVDAAYRIDQVGYLL